jgi:hypothetical protein
MTEAQSRTGVRRYRSRVETEQLAAEFKASGLTRREFSKQHSVALSTLNRYISRYSGEQSVAEPRLLRVEVGESVRVINSGVAVVLVCGRRVELARGFDAATLAQTVCVLERL